MVTQYLVKEDNVSSYLNFLITMLFCWYIKLQRIS